MLFPLNFNDVDYCLKLRDAAACGSSTTPTRSSTTSSRRAGRPTCRTGRSRLLQERHGSAVPDPYYNPGFLETSLNYVAPVTLADGSMLR